MGCLFCGKEIGPIRHLRGSEFCSNSHQKRYGERLGKALDRIAEPEAPPPPLAGFLLPYQMQPGMLQCVSASGFEHAGQPIMLARNWFPLTVTSLAANIPERLREASPAIGVSALSSHLHVGSASLTLALPRIDYTPVFEAAPAPVRVSRTAAGPVPAPAPQAAERIVEAVSQPAWRSVAPAATMPQFAFEAIVHPGVAKPAAPLQPQPVERFVASIAHAEAVAPAAQPLFAPEFLLAPVVEAAPTAVALAGPAPLPEAQPVERLLVAADAIEWLSSAAAVTPAAFVVTPIFDRRMAPPVASAQPAPAETFVVAAAASAWLAGPATPRNPALDVAPLAQSERRATASAGPARPLQAEPAERIVAAVASAESLVFTATLRLPTLSLRLADLATAGPRAAAQKVLAFPAPATQLAWQTAAAASSVPAFAAFDPIYGIFPAVGATRVLQPQAVESLPAAGFSAAPLLAVPAMRMPQLAVDVAASLPELEAEAETVAELFQPGLHVVRPEVAEEPAAVEVPPVAAFVALDYHVLRTASAPVLTLTWATPVPAAVLPAQPVTPIFDRREEPVAAKKTAVSNSIAEIFSNPEARRRSSSSSSAVVWMKAAAACLIVGSFMWFGSSAVRIGRQTPAVNSDVSIGASGGTSEVAGTATETAAGPHVAEPRGPIARLRHAVADRAATTVTDSFKNGMEAWGTSAKSWAAGWSRSADGYVSTGQLALFHPSLNYTDYRLEFLGQIDQKSMGWAVRAHDPKNYYAMKVSVLQAGLRPIIGIEHYPVVNGKRGKASPIPLNVMVHNNSPIQVAVDVRGNKLITSVDGQEVDTWIDDTLPSGGVGFFSDAGSRARLYWMKIARNEDFVGRVCAYISRSLGDGNNTTAELWDPTRPLPGPEPQRAPRREEYALAPAESPDQLSRRTQAWRS